MILIVYYRYYSMGKSGGRPPGNVERIDDVRSLVEVGNRLYLNFDGATEGQRDIRLSSVAKVEFIP